MLKDLCRRIVTWFGMLKFLISDNDLQFDNKAFWRYCSELGITNQFLTPSCPHGNGQAEATNKSIVNGFEKETWRFKGVMDGRASKRVMGIPNYFMTLNMRKILLNDIWCKSRSTCGDKVTDFSDRCVSCWKERSTTLQASGLDRGKLWRTLVRLENYQQKISWGYNKGNEGREFITGDLVLRKVVGNTWDPAMRKLGPTWEGAYRVTSIAGINAYYLKDLDEKPVARPWNVFNLKKYYF